LDVRRHQKSSGIDRIDLAKTSFVGIKIAQTGENGEQIFRFFAL
jgi:hypothetical protein